MIFKEGNTQKWHTSSELKDVKVLLEKNKEDGLWVSDIIYMKNIYGIVFIKEPECKDQVFIRRKKISGTFLREMLAKQFYITDLTFDDDSWIFIFSKFSDPQDQFWSSSPEFPDTFIKEKWSQGFRITDMAFGSDHWTVIMTKNTSYKNQKYIIRKDFSFEEFTKWQSEGIILSEIAYGQENWIMIGNNHSDLSHQVVETSSFFPAGKIRRRWLDGYDLSINAYGGGKLISIFSTKNFETVVEKEKIRTSKELNEANEVIKKLYSEKNYKEVIEYIESYKELSDQEEMANRYLWSLWLNNGTEDRAFNEAKELNKKFNTKKWDIILGHYCKWKEWYDYALDYYKNSDQKGYSEVNGIFNEYYLLFEQKKYQEVINYFESKLSKSVSKNCTKPADCFMWSLYKTNGKESKALEQVKIFLGKYPEQKEWNNLAGHILLFLGSKNKDANMLKQAVNYYNKVSNQDAIDKANDKIKSIDSLERDQILKRIQKLEEEITDLQNPDLQLNYNDQEDVNLNMEDNFVTESFEASDDTHGNFSDNFEIGSHEDVLQISNVDFSSKKASSKKSFFGIFDSNPKEKFICKFCGVEFSSVSSMIGCVCPRHENGPHKGFHAPYEGDIKQRYTCKYCGVTAASINRLTAGSCVRHPLGQGKGFHQPML